MGCWADGIKTIGYVTDGLLVDLVWVQWCEKMSGRTAFLAVQPEGEECIYTKLDVDMWKQLRAKVDEAIEFLEEPED